MPGRCGALGWAAGHSEQTGWSCRTVPNRRLRVGTRRVSAKESAGPLADDDVANEDGAVVISKEIGRVRVHPKIATLCTEMADIAEMGLSNTVLPSASTLRRSRLLRTSPLGNREGDRQSEHDGERS